MGVLVVFITLMCSCFIVCEFMTPVSVGTHEVKMYYIQGLEYKKESNDKTNGAFLLGLGYAKSETVTVENYYFFKVTEYGKQLTSLSAYDSNLYIKETNEISPCLIYIYEEGTINNWFYKSFKGSNKYERLIARQLVVPENTIRIEYNVDI